MTTEIKVSVPVGADYVVRAEMWPIGGGDPQTIEVKAGEEHVFYIHDAVEFRAQEFVLVR